jgi:hypothetical protein
MLHTCRRHTNLHRLCAVNAPAAVNDRATLTESNPTPRKPNIFGGRRRTWQFPTPLRPTSKRLRCARSAPWSRLLPLIMTSHFVSASALWNGSTLQIRSYLHLPLH